MKLPTCALLACGLTLGSVSLFAQASQPGATAQAQQEQQRGGQVQTAQERRNIAAVMGFWRDIWEARNVSQAPKYVGENYVEHGSDRTNGRDALVKNFGRPLPTGVPRTKVTSQKVYARDDFVVLVQDREGPDPQDPSKTRTYNMIELFRVYDGLLQEHWVLNPAQ